MAVPRYCTTRSRCCPPRPRWPICCRSSTARDFVADAFAHCKFIGHVEAAAPLFAKAGIAEADIDEGFVPLSRSKDAASFIEKLGQLRVWGREPSVKMK